MFWKLLTIIIVTGLVAAAMLVSRQERVDTVHAISRTHASIVSNRDTLWLLRARIAQRCKVAALREQLAAIDAQWSAIPASAADMPAAATAADDDAARPHSGDDDANVEPAQ